MCVIAICRDRKLTEEELYSCWQNNDDGAGMAWFAGKKHVIEKGYMKYDELKQRYEDINIFPHVVHFRIATAGGKIPELTHPFICNRKSPTSIEWVGKEPVLFHNGIVTNWYAIADLLGIKVPDQYWSDTRVLASILTEGELDFLEQEGGKYAVLVGKEIVTYGKFIEANGIQFSNSSYDGAWNVYAGFDYYDGWSGGSQYYTPRQGYSVAPQSHTDKVFDKLNPCDGCSAFMSVESCRKYCVEASNPGSLPYKAASKSRALTVVPTKVVHITAETCRNYSPTNMECVSCKSVPAGVCDKYFPIEVGNEDPCTSCRVVSAAVCNKYCPERLKPNFQFKPVGFRGKQVSLCTICNSSGILCHSCSEKDKPGSIAYQKEAEYLRTKDYHLREYSKALSSKDEPFSDCSGRCEECPEYDPVNNNCKEVIKAMSDRKESLEPFEASIKKDDTLDECVDRGESCYTCPNFDPDGYRCMVW